MHTITFRSLAFSDLPLMHQWLTHNYVKAGLSRVQYYIVKVMGVLLVAFGVRIATLSQAIMLPVIAME